MENVMLIVDDMEMNRDVLKVIFQKKYEILEAESGEEALDILERCKDNVDVVILDLVMKGMSGFDVLKKRRTLRYLNSIPFVVVTSSNAMEDQIEAFNLGANDYVTKPFVPEIVLSRVNNVMQSNQRMLSMELEAQKMKVKSEVDEMTGLYNKTTTEQMIDSILQENDGKLHALLAIDIDNFKTVNDTSGHQAGDHVIKIIANLISSMFRKTDVIGRIGGDEFCVLMVDVSNMEVVHRKINELVQIMRYKPNLTIPEYVTISVGLATNKKEPTSYIDMYAKADQALYLAKSDGKAQYREFGVENLLTKEDKRPVIALVSSNRSVCSIINALTPKEIRVKELLDVEELSAVSEQTKNRIAFIYLDVSDKGDEVESYFGELKKIDWIQMDQVIAVCQESNTQQYLTVLQQGVSDLLTAPLDQETFKRRLTKQIEKRQVLLDNKM